MRIVSIAFTPLNRDGRVQRSAAALSEVGHHVTVIGRPPFPEPGSYSCEPLPVLSSPIFERIKLVARHAPTTIIPPLAPLMAWTSRTQVSALRRALKQRPDVVICNDWHTLPVGAAIKRRVGAWLVYDSHEFATREHIQNWKWRLVSQRTAAEIEGANIHLVDLLITVSDGIASALKQLYSLQNRPLVIRNLPKYHAIEFRETKWPITLLFHGLIRPERGLEELIDSITKWTIDAHLMIRGYGALNYVDSLKFRATRLGVSHRVTFRPSVGPDDLVKTAASADLGYLALPGTTEQYEYALPNKLFEYLMAGIGVVATSRLEIAKVIERTGTGVLTEMSPDSLASTLNALSLEKINRMRRAAVAQGALLNWDMEKGLLVKAIETLPRSRFEANTLSSSE